MAYWSQQRRETLRPVSVSLGTLFCSGVKVKKISFVAKEAPKDDIFGAILPLSSLGWQKECCFNVWEIEIGRNTSDIVFGSGIRNTLRPRP